MTAAARTLFTTAIAAHREPEEVVTDRAAALANVIEELFIQNLRRGHYQLGVEAMADHLRCAAAFDDSPQSSDQIDIQIGPPRDTRPNNATAPKRFPADPWCGSEASPKASFIV